jgi:endonuclease/exonuclease/phosphatase family metal-dependent hydrolase
VNPFHLLPATAGLTIGLLLILPACQSEGTGGSGGNGGTATGTNTGTSTGIGGSGGTLPNPVGLKVVNWNVHNLVNDSNDSAAEMEWIEDTAVWNAHRQAVAKVLDAIDPDIVMLQEVENMNVLEAVNDTVVKPFDELYVTDGNDPRGVNVVMMSRVPIDEIVTHKTETFPVLGTPAPAYSYSRDVLEAHLVYNGRPLALFGVHYKAKEDDDPDKRLAEAQHTRGLADQYGAAHPEAGLLILGDFNDLPGSLPCAATAGAEPNLFTDAAMSVPEGDRWTMVYQNNQELVDHQYSNPRLTGLLDEGSVEIWHNGDVTAASDHAPVIAVYQVQ